MRVVALVEGVLFWEYENRGTMKFHKIIRIAIEAPRADKSAPTVDPHREGMDYPGRDPRDVRTL